MAETLDELRGRLEIPNILRMAEGNGGLMCVDIDAPAAGARIYLHGAHVTHWQPLGHKPVIFMSAASLFQLDRAIRGGVPICFPWFGAKENDSAAPAHGFARIMEWRLESTALLAGGDVEVVLSLDINRQTSAAWPAVAHLRHRIVAGRSLEMTLEVLNQDKEAITFEEAQHTYLAVGDVRQVTVKGLDGVTYIDKVDAMSRKQQAGPITITQETDRVYQGTTGAVEVEDPSLHRTIRVEKANSNSTVIWNPWIAKAKAMADFGDDEWPGMVCVETANVGENAVRVEPGQSQWMRTRIEMV